MQRAEGVVVKKTNLVLRGRESRDSEVLALRRLRTTGLAERLSWVLNPYWSIFTRKHSTIATVSMTFFVVCVHVHTCADILLGARV